MRNIVACVRHSAASVMHSVARVYIVSRAFTQCHAGLQCHTRLHNVTRDYIVSRTFTQCHARLHSVLVILALLDLDPDCESGSGYESTNLIESGS